jgi:hypothetical protein
MYMKMECRPKSKNIKSMKIKQLKELKNKMTEKQKRQLLIGLRKIRKEYTGNVGGETDIQNADNLQVNEDEFTAATKPEPNVISKTFDTEADFDSYVHQRRGIEITPKELESIQNFKDAKPIELDRFHVKYETTDNFGNNNTTVIKKLKEGNQFCWTAFSKYETAEEEGTPETSPNFSEEEPEKSKEPSLPPLKEEIPSKPSDEDEIIVNDPIRVIKSITFINDIEGSNVLADFLNKLDI